MENKVYYGEYTLRHWIELILKKNILLPPYQRNFVWKEKKVRELLKTLDKKEFVPPITIGLFKTDTGTQSLILDGQQRLTSILLAYLGIMPDAETFKNKLSIGTLAEGDEIEEYGEGLDDILDWTFNKLTEKGNNKKTITNNIIPGNYKELDLKLTETFFEERYFGFSYIVPLEDDIQNQQKFYSTTFRNINIQGERLLPQESREALYFFNSEMPDFFKPAFCKDIRLKNPSSNIEVPLDFVRYMSLLSQYHADGSEGHLARGCRSEMELYYENYIYSVLKENVSNKYGDFNTVFPKREYQSRLSKLAEAIKLLDLHKQSPFSSIIDMDTFMFGLIYYVIFKKKQLDPSNITSLKSDLNVKVGAYKRDTYHQRSPNAFKYMRPRVAESIALYSKYVITE